MIAADVFDGSAPFPEDVGRNYFKSTIERRSSHIKFGSGCISAIEGWYTESYTFKM